jgi:hypothetical protein
MNLQAVAPILQEIIVKSLEEKRYAYGFSKFRGLGNKVASGRLRNSVQVKVTKSKQGYSVLQVLMEDYATFVNEGRKSGKKGVPIPSLLEWIKARNLKGRDKKGRFITNRSFAFAIQKNIKKYGIRPARFIDVSVEEILEDPRIIDILGDSTVEELIDAIQGI